MPGKTFIQINKPSTKQDSVLCWAFDYAVFFHFSRPSARCHGDGYAGLILWAEPNSLLRAMYVNLLPGSF
jgi:hypothetical protein